MRDKIVFSTYFCGTLGKEFVVPVLASTKGNIVYVYPNAQMSILEFLNERKNTKTIMKKVSGECGDGIYLIEWLQDEFTVNHKKMEMDEFISEISEAEYIIQDFIEQHEALRMINPSCVNTIRFVTISVNNEIHYFAHFLRFGVGESVNDNRATGGYAVNISDQGKLDSLAIGHNNSIKEHPNTGVIFEGYQLPFWEETKKLVTKAHEQLKDIKSIGWDIAITSRGPVLLEGNDNWEICGPQDMEGGLKARWKEFHNKE